MIKQQIERVNFVQKKKSFKFFIRKMLFVIVAQLNEIRKVKLSRIVCDNSDHIESAQIYVMVLPDPQV